MQRMTVRHTTSYRYASPVSFGPHRLMFRPRDSFDLRLVSTALTIQPAAKVRWLHDVFGNSIAIATFAEQANELRFESRIELEHYGIEKTEFPIEDYARVYPFSYPVDELPDLVRSIERHYPDPEHKVDAWARQFVVEQGRGPTDTSEMLTAMTRAIKEGFRYQARDDYGVQSPTETLRLGSGSCRDYALLMMEAARALGFAARFVTGYLYVPALDGKGSGSRGPVGGGATHAWAAIYLPGAGWVEFDPTNGIIGGPDLIRVAVARDPAQASPLSGTFTGPGNAFLGMTIDVQVTAE